MTLFAKWQLQLLAAGFRRHQPSLCRNMEDPELAEGSCQGASLAFARFAREVHQPLVLVECRGQGHDAYERHVVTRCGDWVADWSARQYSPQAPVPQLRRLGRLQQEWTRVADWSPDGHPTPRPRLRDRLVGLCAVVAFILSTAKER